jgi:hypothetical protein
MQIIQQHDHPQRQRTRPAQQRVVRPVAQVSCGEQMSSAGAAVNNPFFARDDLGYRRSLITAAYDGLRRRGLPEVLLVHSWLPEGVTVCAVRVFAAMIEEAYHTPGALLMNPPDEDVAPAPAGPAAGRGHRCSVRRHDDTGRRRKDERDQTGAATTGTGTAVDLQLVRRGPMTGRR